MSEISLYNTRTRTKQPFVPIDASNVRMYVCGPTVYDRAHIGNARPVVVFDVLFRLLRHVYGPQHVTYVRNVTDVDDKINARAAAEKRPIRGLTDETLAAYHADMDALGALRPTHEPRATDFIPQMVAMIETLIALGHAYAAECHVLFAVASFPEYGRFAHRSLDEMQAGARVEVAPYKRDPMDFVLWKPSTAAEPGWPSPWGHGRPGWHIECSAMSEALLGASFDIHGGGIDLVFPHHENEIAQSRGAHPEGSFANVWMHNGFLNVEGEKMSKSLGNFFTVREILDKYNREFAIENMGPAVRLRFLQSRYREPINWSEASLEAAGAKVGLWSYFLEQNDVGKVDAIASTDLLEGTAFISALKDDLNTSQAIVEIDGMIKRSQQQQAIRPDGGVYPSGDAWDHLDREKSRVRAAIELLGFDAVSMKGLRHDVWSNRLRRRALGSSDGTSELIEELLVARAKARDARDFARADRIRDALLAADVKLMDREGEDTQWELGRSFDPSKLAGIAP